MAIVLVVNLYVTRVILRNLGAEDYGIYNVVYGFVTMFAVFNVTLTAGINRYYNSEMGKSGLEGITKVYNVSIRIQAICTIIVFVLVELIGVWYVNNHMVMDSGRLASANWVFQFSVVSMLFLLMQNPYCSAVLAFEKMDFYALVSIMDVLLKLVIAISMAVSPIDKLVYYGITMSIISVIDFLAYYIYCKVKFRNSIYLTTTYDKRTFKEMIRFSGWMALDPLAGSINGQGVNMLINSFFGTIVNTAYGIANQVGQAIDTFCMNLSTAFRPQMVQSYSSGDKQRSIRLFISMTKLSYILFLLICVPFIYNIRFIYDFWLGNTYPSIAISISVIFILVKLIGCFHHPMTYLIMAKGELKRYMIITSIITSAILPVAYILLKCGSPVESVFIALFIITSIIVIIGIFVLSIEIPEFSIRVYFRSILIPCMLLSAIVFGVVYASHQLFFFNKVLVLLTDIATSIVVTLLTSYLLCFDSSEKNLVKTIIGDKVTFRHVK